MVGVGGKVALRLRLTRGKLGLEFILGIRQKPSSNFFLK